MSRKRKRSRGRGCYTLPLMSSQPSQKNKQGQEKQNKRKSIESKRREYHDLEVPLLFDYSTMYSGNEEDSSSLTTKKKNQRCLHHHLNHVTLLHRLAQTGYSVIALSHSVHGTVDEKDHAGHAVPISSMIDSIDQQQEGEEETETTNKDSFVVALLPPEETNDTSVEQQYSNPCSFYTVK